MKSWLTLSLAVMMGASLYACSNITDSNSFTPEQRLKNSDSRLARAGMAFNENNGLTACESLYRSVCEDRVAVLEELIADVIGAYGSEQSAPLGYQQRMAAANLCIDTLKADLNNDAAMSCHR